MPSKRKEVSHRDFLAQGVRVTIGGLATSERYDSPEAAKLRTAIENTKPYIKLRRDIGSSGVRVFPNSFHDSVPREKTIEQIGNSLNIPGAFAADYGRQVRPEAHGNAGELPTISAIMDRVDQPSVRVKLNSDKRDIGEDGYCCRGVHLLKTGVL